MSKVITREEAIELDKKKFVLELTGLEIQCLKESLDLSVRNTGIGAAEICLKTLVSLNRAKPLMSPEEVEKVETPVEEEK